MTQNLCGKTQYFGDLYQNSQCEFRKCSDKCLAGTETFLFEGISYSRTRYLDLLSIYYSIMINILVCMIFVNLYVI